MKRFVFAILCMVVLVGYGNLANADLGIKQASEYISIPLIEPLDTAGLPLKPDSVHIITYADNGSAAAYTATNTTYPFSAVGIDTIKIYGDTLYFFVDQIQDIDGGGGNFELAITVTFFCDGLPTTTRATVQVVSDSLENFLDASKDSSSSAAVLSKNSLDTLQAQDDWVAQEAGEIGDILDTLQNQDDWVAQETSVDALEDTADAILDTIQAHAPHGNDWGQGGGAVAAVADTVNAILDTLQLWDDDIAFLTAIRDSVNALLDSIQAVVGVDAIQLSGDAGAANNLETMLDGTGGQTLDLGALHIVASGDDTAFKAVGSGVGHGIFAGGGAGTGNAMHLRGGATSGDGLYVYGQGAEGYGAQFFGAGSGEGINIAGGGSAGHGIRIIGGLGGGHGIWAVGSGGYDIYADIHGTIDRATFVDSVDSVIKAVSATATVDTESVARSVWNNAIIAKANRTVTASCAGSGARTVIIYVKRDTDSTAIAGFDISVNDSTSGDPKARLNTNVSGVCTLSLDDATYAIHMIKTPWTITSPVYPAVSSDTTLTYYATAFDPGVPPAATLCRIYAWESDFQDVVEGGWRLQVFISDKYAPVKNSSGNIVGRKGRSPAFYISDADSGYMYLDVYRSDSLTAADATKTVKYHIRLYNKDNDLEAYKNHYEVPALGNHKIIW